MPTARRPRGNWKLFITYMNLIKHLFKQHTYPAIAVLLLIIIIAAVPEMQVKEIKQASINKLATVGGSFIKKESKDIAQTYYLGEGSNNLEVAGSYDGRKTTIYKVVVKDSGKYELSKDDEIIGERPIMASKQDLGDGIEIKFGTISGHQPGDQWLIVATPPSYVVALSNMTGDIGRTVVAIKDGTNNILAKAQGAVLAFINPSKTIARVSKDQVNYLPASTLPPVIALNEGNRGGTALFDIEIAPAEAQKENKIPSVIVFAFLALTVVILAFFVIRKLKRKKV